MSLLRFLFGAIYRPFGPSPYGSPNDGDPQPVTVDGDGNLNVVVNGTISSSSVGTGSGRPIIFFYTEPPSAGFPFPVGDDTEYQWAGTANGAGQVNLRDQNGTEIGVASDPVRVDPTGTTPQPVTDNGGSLTVDGTVTANAGTNLNTSLLALEAGGNLAGAATSLAVIDDWDESDRAKVNLIAGQAGVQGGSGAVSATTQRVVLATDVALPTGSNTIGAVNQGTSPWVVTPTPYVSEANFTRPSNTTAYANNDAVSNSTSSPSVITFTNCAIANGGTGTITGLLMTSSSFNTGLDFRLMLFDTAPTGQNDNDAIALTDAQTERCIGIIAISNNRVGNNNSGSSGNNIFIGSSLGSVGEPLNGLNYTCLGGSTSIYGVLTAAAAYTPSSAEKFSFRLSVLRYS